MTAANRMESFLATMKWEGGEKLSLDRRDPGNWTGGKVGVGALKGTKWGVAAAAHSTLDIANLKPDEALCIFVESYWNPIGGDDLPAGLDHSAADDAYNSGPSSAARRLAKVQARAGLSVAARIQAYSQLRLSFLESLKGWRVFGPGWARRVAGVEAESLKMARAVAVAPLRSQSPAVVSDQGDRGGFLTPADSPPRRAETITFETIVRAGVDAEEACKDARSSVVVIGAASGGAALWCGSAAPIWLIALGLIAPLVLLIPQLWAWRAHSARGDALAALARDFDRNRND